MNRSELRAYVDHATKALDVNPDMNEAKTKFDILNEFLDILGWRDEGDIDPEYPVMVGTTTHNVDYALQESYGGRPEILFEAKAATIDLKPTHRDQLRSYMLVSDVSLGILTNSRTYELLWRQVENGNVSVHTLGVLALEDLPDAYDLLHVYSIDAFGSGDAMKRARQFYQLNRAAHQLDTKRDELLEDITESIVDVTGGMLADEARTAAADVIDQLAAKARGQSTEGTEEAERQRESFWADVKRETGIANQNGAVVLSDDRPAKASFVRYVDFLVKNGYITDSDVPIESGYKRYLLHSKPIDRKGDDMTSPAQIGDYYLETNYSRADIKQRIAELGERFRESV